MTIQQSSWVIGAFGLLTTLMLWVGANTLGGLMALVQLCFLVGAPLAFVMFDQLRSWQVVIVIAATLSVALSAISVQFLIWFRIASPVNLVLTATAYGVVLALLFSSVDLRPSDAEDLDGEDEPDTFSGTADVAGESRP